MRYSIRDLLGHFAKRPQEGKPCPHKCCKGRRRHPAERPIIPDRDVLRAMSEEALVRHVSETGSRPELVEAAIRELDRRERAAARAGRRKEAAEASKAEHHLAVHAAYIAAESETRGHMLNARGRAAGVDPRTLWTGSERRAHAYASEELRAYWDRHGRLTAADWRKQSRGARDAAEYADEQDARRARTRERLYGVY
jgi:hypothetical protein